jgi:hypothetical protein
MHGVCCGVRLSGVDDLMYCRACHTQAALTCCRPVAVQAGCAPADDHVWPRALPCTAARPCLLPHLQLGGSAALQRVRSPPRLRPSLPNIPCSPGTSLLPADMERSTHTFPKTCPPCCPGRAGPGTGPMTQERIVVPVPVVIRQCTSGVGRWRCGAWSLSNAPAPASPERCMHRRAPCDG